jgi:proline racemase
MRLSRTMTVVGCHAEGEVGRVITGGVLPPPGATLMEKKLYLEREADHLRRFLLFEPRGGAFTHANLVLPPVDPRADAAFIVMEPADYPPMSGSNCICVTTVLLETGMLPMVEPETRLTLETPGGLVAVTARCRDGKCVDVRLENVPCFPTHLDVPVEVEGLGTITADIAYGGAFFCIVDAAALGFSIRRDEARELVETGERIKAAAAAQCPVVHPELPEVHTVTFTQFAAPVVEADGVKTGANAVVISPGKIDRSPCGTGTSARLAVLHAKGRIAVGEPYVSRSILGTTFHASVVRETAVAGRRAIVPSIRGRAWVTGISQYGLDPTDPFPEGYTLSDTWYRALG